MLPKRPDIHTFKYSSHKRVHGDKNVFHEIAVKLMLCIQCCVDSCKTVNTIYYFPLSFFKKFALLLPHDHIDLVILFSCTVTTAKRSQDQIKSHNVHFGKVFIFIN